LLNDRYRALEAIGQGGFGRTFLAIDELKPSRPRCVIKQFFPQTVIESPDKAAELFRREAIQLDELGQHPQIPNLLAYFEDDQQKYLIQDYIEGLNLNQELQLQGAFNESQIRLLLADLLPVLQYIHARQVIHRDIKPENIIRRASDRHLVLVDFGASTLAVGDNSLKPGTRIGSRGYVAPEQANGQATFASDLYSLGATCLHLLTERFPVGLRTDQGWIWKQYLKHPISKSLELILDRLLDPELSYRYASADQVLQALEKAQKQESQRSPSWDINSVKTVFATEPPLPPPSPPLAWECIQTFAAHQSWIRTIAFSPDGRLLATGSGDKTIKLWSVETGECVRVFPEHASWVRAIAISPDGKMLASAANDRLVWLWNLATGQLQNTLAGHTDWVRAVAFSADGQTLVTGSQDKTAILWDLNTTRPLHTLTHHNHWVITVAVSSDNQTIATGSCDQTIQLWQRSSGKYRPPLVGHSNEVISVNFSPDGRLLASSSKDQTVKLWTVPNSKHAHTFDGHTNAVNTAIFSPDGKLLATSSNDLTIKLWQVNNGKLLHTLTGHKGWVWAIAFSPNGQLLASSSWDGTIKLWRRSP
jgi:WD40 repeat protein